MKKAAFLFLVLLCSVTFTACGPSRTQIQEMSSACDILIEVHHVQNDSIALFIGNTLFINTQQLVRDDIFPFLVSKRDPTNIDIPTATTVLNNKEEFFSYLQKSSTTLTSFGIIIGENISNEIGFDETKAIQKIVTLLQSIEGGSAMLFNEKGGQLVKAKKLY